MNSFFKKIIISAIMIAIFLAPVSGKIKINKTEAQVDPFADYKQAFKESKVEFKTATQTTADFYITIHAKESDWNNAYFLSSTIFTVGFSASKRENSTVLVIMENGNYVSSYDLSGEVRIGSTSHVGFSGGYWIGPVDTADKAAINELVAVNNNLKAGKTYTAQLYYLSDHGGNGGGIDLFGSTKKDYYAFGTIANFTTPKDAELPTGENLGNADAHTTGIADNSAYFDCSGILPWTDITCKVAAFLYFVLFQPIAAFTWLAAKLLDFFVYYSTNSTSYGGDFVKNAWIAVRDVANIFFIIALLYVAIKTILGLNVTDNKKLVGTVIIIALIINFSLFTTKVVIDGSNILAKIFYNNITSKDANAKNADGTLKDSASGAGGQKSVSVGLVKQFNPQEIISAENFKGHEGLFIFITLLSLILMLFMIYIFISVSLLFVTRVVSLWLSMIFSPIAFASYTVPFDIPGFGHKEWWKNLLENSLLAPIFIFFLYIIILFGDAMKNIPYDISNTSSSVGGYLDAAMKTIIPFIIIFILLKNAKDLAVKYSGELGKSVAGIGSKLGGLATGGIMGGAALLARNTVGRASAAAANSGWAKQWESNGWGGGMARSALKAGAKGSFDVRGVKIGGVGLSNTLGKSKEGGWEKTRKDKVEKRQKRAEELKVGEDEKVTQDINRAEMDLQVLLNKVTGEFDKIDKDLVNLRQQKSDAGTTAEKEAIAILIADKVREKKELKNGTAANAPRVIGGVNDGKTISELENSNDGIITVLKNKKQTESRRRTTNYANMIAEYGGLANREAQHKIIMESKLDSGTKT